jgi:pilus assembly protein Flp/PilA
MIVEVLLFYTVTGPVAVSIGWFRTCSKRSGGKQAPVPLPYTREEKQMKNLLARLWKEEEGQDLTEYALLLVLVALAAIGSLGTLATAINKVFSTAAGNLSTTT